MSKDPTLPVISSVQPGGKFGGTFSSVVTLPTGVFKGLLTRMERRGR